MKKILVAYEGLVQTKTLQVAKDLAKDSKAGLIIIRVIPYGAAGINPEIQEHIKALDIKEEGYKETRAKALIKRETEDGLRSVGIEPSKVMIRIGEPATEIIKAADETGCDLLIIGSRRLGGKGEIRLGAIAERIMRYANKPVLVVK